MKLRVFAVFIFCLLLASCGPLGLRRIELPATPILTGGQGWGMVKSSYVRIKSKPGAESPDHAALRDGSLVRIVGREFAPDESGLWFKISTEDEDPKVAKAQAKAGFLPVVGYVPEAEVEVYATKSQAERAFKAKAGN